MQNGSIDDIEDAALKIIRGDPLKAAQEQVCAPHAVVHTRLELLVAAPPPGLPEGRRDRTDKNACPPPPLELLGQIRAAVMASGGFGVHSASSRNGSPGVQHFRRISFGMNDMPRATSASSRSFT